MSSKIRLDQLLVDRGLAPGRDKAKALIMAGLVFIGEQKAYKAGQTVNADDCVTLRGGDRRYVGRGGYKLEKALKVFDIDLQGKTAMDIGCSTGGFTDCMLQKGIAHVYAVDVGYNQLDYKLRTDSRITVMERTNARYMDPTTLPAMDFICCDLSFISLKLIFGVAYSLLKDGGEAVVLVKPQFEAGRQKVGKGGIVRDKAVHKEVLSSTSMAAEQAGFSLKGLDFSPIKGQDGNIEFLMLMDKSGVSNGLNIEEVVEAAHEFKGI